MKPAIAYIEQKFPGLTTTFIYREVFALEELGFDVTTLSIHTPKLDELSDEAKPLVATTHYIDATSWFTIAKAHAHFLIDRPAVYLKTLFFIATRIRGSCKDRRRTLLHFIGAVYFALLCQERRVQHIHAHFAVLSTTIAMVISRLLGITYSFTAHNSCFWEQILLPEKIAGARFVLAISLYTRNFLISQVPDRPDLHQKIHIVRCGVPVERFTPAGKDIPPRQTPVILSVAQLAEHKGMIYLIEACAILKNRRIPFLCTIAGDGPQEERLKNRIAKLELGEEVRLAGRIFQEEIHDLLCQADLFALACIHTDAGKVDGIPVALMEAMAAAIPCVSTTVSGIPDLIDNGVNGILVEPRNALALADTLERLLTNPELRTRLGEAARQKVVAEFNLNHTAPQIAELIRSEIQSHD